MSLISFGGWTMPTTFDLSAWQTPTVDVSPVEDNVDETPDIFTDTTQDFSINTLMPNINTSEGNLLGFTELQMTPEQKVQYGIANEQEATQVANDPFAALNQIGTNIKQAATTEEGAAQIKALQDNAYNLAKESYEAGEYNVNNNAANVLKLAQETSETYKDNPLLSQYADLALTALTSDSEFMEEANKTSDQIIEEAGGFDNYYKEQQDKLAAFDMSDPTTYGGSLGVGNDAYFDANKALSEAKYLQWKAGTRSSPINNPLFNIAANALTGGAWSVATGAFNTIDSAVNEEWGDALKSGAMTYASYNTVEANSLLDKADDLDAMGYADAADTLRNEAAALKDTASAVGGINDIVNGDVFSGMLTGAPLIGVDPVGSVMETVFGVTAEEDALNNAKFGGGWDVSAASEGIVDAAGTLLDTGSLSDAAQSGLLTYAKEGGSTPFEMPQGEGYWGIPSFNLGKYLPDVDIDVQLPEWLRFNPDFDVEGWALSGLTVPDWLKINGSNIDLGSLNLPNVDIPRINLGDTYDDIDFPDVNLPDVNLPDVNVPDVNLPDVNVPDVNLPDVNLPNIDTPEFSSPEFSSPEFSSFDAELPSFDFDLSLGEGKDLEGIVTDPRWKKIPNINTVATLLQKMTPKQKNDYLEMLLRSMQA